METYFIYVDGIVMFLAVLGAFFLTKHFKKQAAISIRVVPLFFAIFGASVVVSSMAAGHLLENAYRAAVRVYSGGFVFDFHFYSIMLMGAVVLAFGSYMLWQVHAFISGQLYARRRFILAALILSAVTMPLFLLSPIGILPAMACAVAIPGIAFAYKPVRLTQMQPTGV